jgi:hypothetical protein
VMVTRHMPVSATVYSWSLKWRPIKCLKMASPVLARQASLVSAPTISIFIAAFARSQQAIVRRCRAIRTTMRGEKDSRLGCTVRPNHLALPLGWCLRCGSKMEMSCRWARAAFGVLYLPRQEVQCAVCSVSGRGSLADFRFCRSMDSPFYQNRRKTKLP